jgi:hypothetical protein
MTAATAGAGGLKGAVPASAAGDQTKFLRADATWALIPASGTVTSLTTTGNTTATLVSGVLNIPNYSGVQGSGTTNNVPKWGATPSTLVASLITDTGTNVGIKIVNPVANLHVNSGSSQVNSIKLTTLGSGSGAQDGVNFTLSSVAAQIWLYETNIPFRIGVGNVERFVIEDTGQGFFKYGLKIHEGIVDINTTKGTAGQILSSTGTEVAWVNASSAHPERLIQRTNRITLSANTETDITFQAISTPAQTSSTHINAVDLQPTTSSVEIVANATLRIAISAFVQPTSTGQTRIRMYNTTNSPAAKVHELVFNMPNPHTNTFEALSSFIFHDVVANETYKFTIEAISSGTSLLETTSTIELEVIK